jgi:hypothetical protein
VLQPVYLPASALGEKNQDVREVETALRRKSFATVSACQKIDRINLRPFPPFLCTDFCEEAAAKSCEMVKALFAEAASVTPFLNPFRSVVPSCGGGTRLPSCSNALLFGWLCPTISLERKLSN